MQNQRDRAQIVVGLVYGVDELEQVRAATSRAQILRVVVHRTQQSLGDEMPLDS